MRQGSVVDVHVPVGVVLLGDVLEQDLLLGAEVHVHVHGDPRHLTDGHNTKGGCLDHFLGVASLPQAHTAIPT